MLILNQRLNFVLVYCIYHINYLWKHFFITLAAYWSPFVTNMFKRFINLFFVVVVVVVPLFCRLNVTKQLLKYRCPLLWNNVPHSLRESEFYKNFCKGFFKVSYRKISFQKKKI